MMIPMHLGRTIAFAIAVISSDLAWPVMASASVSNGAKYVLSIPAPISVADLQSYSRMLVLAAPQEEYLKGAHQAYLNRWEEYWGKHRLEVDALSRDAAAALDISLAVHAPLYQQFAEAEDRALRELVRLDSAMLDELATFLADSQALSLPRVRLARERARASLGDCIVAAARIDLSVMATAFVLQAKDDEQVLASICPILLEYEQALTPIVITIDRGQRSFRIEKQYLVIDGTEKNTQRLRDEARADAALQLRAREINDRFAVRIANELPPELSRQFLNWYRRSAYAPAYFEELPVQSAIQDAVATAGDHTQRDALGVIVNSSNERLEKNRRELESLVVERQAALAGMNGELLQGITTRWDEVVQRRIQIHIEALTAVMALSSPELKLRLNELIEALRTGSK